MTQFTQRTDELMGPERLLVPLDGSRLAESVLPTVLRLARGCRARVILLHIIEQNPPATIHGEPHLMHAGDAQAYLERIAQRIHGVGIEVETHVHEDGEQNVAQSIFAHARELYSDIVVMCTHGQGGLRDLLFGSIAQQALQRGTQSILLVLPREDGSAPDFDPRHILVPLDGTAAHEPALPVALAIARIFAAQLHLAFVIPTIDTLTGEQAVPGLLLPTTMKAVLDLAQQGAEDYLEQAAARCRSAGVSTDAHVLRGDVTPALLGLAGQLRIDLLVMASHGRTGLDALLKGSVAARITGKVGRQILLVRAKNAGGKKEGT
ncbi:MAG: universal stress protein [Ktedonobacteraceae bacterium]|nr:universal stress protein [Ktedonobacteraceae bacterium]